MSDDPFGSLDAPAANTATADDDVFSAAAPATGAAAAAATAAAPAETSDDHDHDHDNEADEDEKPKQAKKKNTDEEEDEEEEEEEAEELETSDKRAAASSSSSSSSGGDDPFDVVDGGGGDGAAAASSSTDALGSPSQAKGPKQPLPPDDSALRAWQAERDVVLRERQKQFDEQKQAILSQAKDDINKFYADLESKLAKAQKQNRLDEKNFRSDMKALMEHGSRWEKVAKVVNLAPKATEKGAVPRLERMRKLLLNLKADTSSSASASAASSSSSKKQ